MNKIVTLIIILLLTANCSMQAQIQKIYINTKSYAVAKQSSYIKSVNYISLQIPADIEIHKHDYFMVHKNYFIFEQSSSKSILFFSKGGRFVKSISYKKLGKDFVPVFNRAENVIKFFGSNKNYTLTTKDRIIIDENYRKPRFKKYFRKYIIDLSDTTLTLKRTRPDKNDISITYKIFGDYYIRLKCQTSPLFKDSIDYELRFYKGDKLLGKYFPYNHNEEPKLLYNNQTLSVICSNTQDSTEKYISRYFCDTIYRLNKMGIQPAYKVVLPLENKLPNYFFTKSFKNKAERENFKQNNGSPLSIPFVIVDKPSFVVLGIAFLNNYKIFLYDKRNKKTFSLNRIVPVKDFNFGIPVLNQFDDNFFEGKMYSLLLAKDIIANYKPNKQTLPPLALQHILQGKSHNPVIAVIALKN